MTPTPSRQRRGDELPPIIPGNPYDRARYFPSGAWPMPSETTALPDAVAEARGNKERRRVRLVLPYIPPRDAFPRAFEGRHWSARSGIKAKMKQDVLLLVQSDQDIKAVIAGKPFEHAHITITFRSPRGNYDGDNVLSASKGWIDGLVEAGILQNDTIMRVSYTVQWERKVEEETEILVEEQGDDHA